MAKQQTSQKTEDNLSASGTSYDAVPYKGHSYPMSHPRHLAVVARLFGLNPPAPEKARILEIGCAEGNNLIPVALAAPKCTCLGIDLSERQIVQGRRTIEDLGIKNVILETMSVTDIPANLGQFDYIICHGVFSWVSPEVQEHILRVCSENLTPRGIAFISYNTLPGWNAVKSIREMMLYHTAQFADPAEKIDEALKMMRFVAGGLKNEDNLWRKTIEQELKTINGTESWYVYHEHLENENRPFYFHEFMDMAARHNLRYVGDSQVSTMYVGALDKDVAQTLSQLTDIVRQEQYMDFVRNRRFRMTILTHAAQQPNFTLTPGKISEFRISAGNLKLDFDPATQDWTKDVERSFNNKMLNTKSRFIAYLLFLLCEQPSRLFTVDELIETAAGRLGAKSEPALRAAWEEHALRLCFFGCVALYDGPYQDVLKLSAKPKALELARHQARHSSTVTNARHETLRVDKAVQALLPLLDGTKTVKELAAPFVERLEAAGANFLEGGIPTGDPARKLAIASEQVKTCLGTCLANKLLVG